MLNITSIDRISQRICNESASAAYFRRMRFQSGSKIPMRIEKIKTELKSKRNEGKWMKSTSEWPHFKTMTKGIYQILMYRRLILLFRSHYINHHIIWLIQLRKIHSHSHNNFFLSFFFFLSILYFNEITKFNEFAINFQTTNNWEKKQITLTQLLKQLIKKKLF